jgi:hypothetical protein
MHCSSLFIEDKISNYLFTEPKIHNISFLKNYTLIKYNIIYTMVFLKIFLKDFNSKFWSFKFRAPWSPSSKFPHSCNNKIF